MRTAPRIAVLFHRLGPYHHARLRAAAACADIVAVEFSDVDHTYAWETVAAPTAFKHVTIFRDREVEAQPLWQAFRGIGRALRAARPDVVAIPGWSGRGSLAALAWCRATRTPAIVMSASTAHDHVRVPRKELVKRMILSGFSGALAGGQAQADYLVALGLPRNKVCVGYDVVDNAHFATGAAAARRADRATREALGLPPRYFLTSSRFVRKKNLPVLLRAFAGYRRQAGPDAASLVLIGDGPEAPRVAELVAELSLSDAVILPGFKQYDALPAFYGLAEAFVLASTSEQWGLVVNEAMAAGLPVLVSSKCGCAPDLIEEGHNGFVFDPQDEAALTRLLLEVGASADRRAAMGQVSEEIIRRWSPATFADGLLAASLQALDERNGRRWRQRPLPATASDNR